LGKFVTTGKRLKEEREKFGFNQTDFAAIGGVGRKSQFNYEEDERRPDSDYLAAIATVGVDVRYIITGDRVGPVPEVLTADERYLLEQYRNSPQALKNAALRVLLGGEVQRPPKIKIDGKVTGQVVEGGLVNNGPVSFGSKGRVKKK
jgi:transcriptional regulator with XRE-family HTH domain